MGVTSELTQADLDRMNQRIGLLLAEGFPPSEALTQAWNETYGRNRDELPNGLKLTLLRAPDDEAHQSPAFQEEIRELESDLQATGVEARARWLVQDSVHAWCGYVGVLVITLPIVKAISPVIVAYIKRRTGRKVQVEYDGYKVKIEEASSEEVDRVLNLIEQRRAEKRKKK